ncbi:uncharacterized protein PGTG_11273 [Puccinia graminis f. sp. tritici CRL 75-36-700-3]|uniref:RING-type E3 ubiquitin transferase n=1 Tax=Puccinia graminis f. sp. tritici (strain CRL 75-36-700-3 / race SCCL) TaxID=418459 RepID=E3KLC9_PUCGT|nr:uncharacterized protein PGTG_11273 [Puccinia graminis f. sp. tritici CRL 75-36-700-3]EFP85104.1 hypothetical protein PGTG_11273 [Puccinia graminis f. sp. tritici CRL 75-36-700-3]
MDPPSNPGDSSESLSSEGGLSVPSAAAQLDPVEGPVEQEEVLQGPAEQAEEAAIPESKQSDDNDNAGMEVEEADQDEDMAAEAVEDDAEEALEPLDYSELFRPAGILPMSFPLPQFEEFESMAEILEQLQPLARAIVRGFLYDLRDIFRERIDYYQNFQIPEFHHHLVLLSDRLLVIKILNSADPAWTEALLSEYIAAVDEYVEEAAERFHRLHLSYTYSQPDSSPPPAHLVSEDAPGGPATCTICLIRYAPDSQVVVLACHDTHHFHRSCLSRWVYTQATCPLCRILVE